MRRMIRSSLLAAFVAVPLAAHAADVTIVVTDDKGHPVKDAVVILNGPTHPPQPGHFTINQKDMTFVPFVLVVPVGSTIETGGSSLSLSPPLLNAMPSSYDKQYASVRCQK